MLNWISTVNVKGDAVASKSDIPLKPADYDTILKGFETTIATLNEIEMSLGPALESSPTMRNLLTAVLIASDRAYYGFKSKARRVDWPEWRDGYPVLPAQFAHVNRNRPGEIVIAVDCPFCGVEHAHGSPVGTGVPGATSWLLRSHCTRGPLLHGSYYVQLEDACRQTMTRVKLRTR